MEMLLLFAVLTAQPWLDLEPESVADNAAANTVWLALADTGPAGPTDQATCHINRADRAKRTDTRCVGCGKTPCDCVDCKCPSVGTYADTYDAATLGAWTFLAIGLSPKEYAPWAVFAEKNQAVFAAAEAKGKLAGTKPGVYELTKTETGVAMKLMAKSPPIMRAPRAPQGTSTRIVQGWQCDNTGCRPVSGPWKEPR